MSSLERNFIFAPKLCKASHFVLITNRPPLWAERAYYIRSEGRKGVGVRGNRLGVPIALSPDTFGVRRIVL